PGSPRDLSPSLPERIPPDVERRRPCRWFRPDADRSTSTALGVEYVALGPRRLRLSDMDQGVWRQGDEDVSGREGTKCIRLLEAPPVRKMVLRCCVVGA